MNFIQKTNFKNNTRYKEKLFTGNNVFVQN